MNATAEVQVVEMEETRASWDRIADGYDEYVTPSHFLLGRQSLNQAGLKSGERFLDVAAGSGALSIPAARLGADVLATDFSPNMLRRLESRAGAEGLELRTRVMDGHALELEDDSFDVAGSQFGVMLFPDMPRGIAEMARVAKPGGRVLVTAFGDPHKVEFLGFLTHAIQTVVPDFTGPRMDPPPLPFQLREPQRLKQELEAAGLRQVRIDTTVEELEFRDGRQLWNWLTQSNPIVECVLAELALTGEQRAAVQDALDGMVRRRGGAAGPAVLTNPINIGVGIK